MKLERAAVLGAGTMGAQIAAHLANVGIESYLLDLPADGPDRSKLARGAISKMLKMKPSPFFLSENASLIQPGNFEDDLEKVGECDWIVEAIAEKLEWKRDLWSKVAPLRRAGAIVSSNTSGLPLSSIADGFPEDFRRHWLGTHFFNPPRYMKLLEIIPDRDTLPGVVEAIQEFGDRVLGKGVVLAKDCPNFIANRIGTFAAARAMQLRQDLGLTIEEVDVLTGPATGRPKTGTFKLGDLVGIDVLMHVGQNLYDNLPQDPFREVFLPDSLMKTLVAKGATGRKAGAGFYRKEGREILVLDPEEGEYRSQQPPRLPALAKIKGVDSPVERVRLLLEEGGREADFLWPLLRDTFVYSAGRVPEISDYIYSVDEALRWGFAWDLGPFEMWDGLGVPWVAQRCQEEGVDLPEWVGQVLAQPQKSFYALGEERLYFDLSSGDYLPLPTEPEKIDLPYLKKKEGAIAGNDDASLIDLGEGVACFEFHSKMNSLTPAIIDFSQKALGEVEKNFRGMVIGNQASDFSVGANLVFLLQASMGGQWDEIRSAVEAFQMMTSSFRYSPKPVVAAPFGRTLAGGCEVCLGCDSIVAAAETYMGLVEVGVGLIPAGGGTKELLIRCTEEFGDDLSVDRLPGLKEAFQTIGMAKVSTSAEEARRLRFLRSADEIEINGDRLIHRAKQAVLHLADSGYRQPRPRQNIVAAGQPVLAALRVGLHLMERARFISEYDRFIGDKLCYVLTGGDLNRPALVSEEYFLELEREAFISLCGEEKTRQRIKAMLETGKPLRN